MGTHSERPPFALSYFFMGNPIEEKGVFEGFMAAAPIFAGAAVINWLQPTTDPPDIECNTSAGRKIGVELTSWLEESQIGRAKRQESLEESFLDAIKPEPPNETEHIQLVWMSPRRRVRPADATNFRTELLKLMEHIDKRWEGEPEWDSPHGFQWNDFTAYRTLSKYLDAVDVHPRRPSLPSTMRKGGRHWLTFPMRGGSYSPGDMVDALCEVIQAKIAKYSAKPNGMDDFYLLVHYDKAWEYNTPVVGIDFGYAEAVEAVARRIGGSVGMFDKIFVFVPIANGEKVFPIFPM